MQKQLLIFGTGLALVVGLGVWKSSASSTPPRTAPPPSVQGGLIDGSDQAGADASSSIAALGDLDTGDLDVGDLDVGSGDEIEVAAAPSGAALDADGADPATVEPATVEPAAADTSGAAGMPPPDAAGETAGESTVEPPPPPTVTVVDPAPPREGPELADAEGDSADADSTKTNTAGPDLRPVDADPPLEPIPGTAKPTATPVDPDDADDPDAAGDPDDAGEDEATPPPQKRQLGKRQENGLLLLTFEDLAYYDWLNIHDLSEEEKAARETEFFLPPTIPDDILALDGQTVIVEGFMIPMEFKDGQVTSFLLAKSLQGCCYGVSPLPHELVEVTMPEGKGSYYVQWEPVYVTGKLVIKVPNEELPAYAGIYHMAAESVDTFE